MPAWSSQRACGVEDVEAKFPDPIHFDCKGCHTIVIALLKARIPTPAVRPMPSQIEGPWMAVGDTTH